MGVGRNRTPDAHHAPTDEDDIDRWVNQRVLADTDETGAMLERQGLIIDPDAE